MAKTPALSIEKLIALEPQKLAELILNEAHANAGFRRQVKVALASKNGPEAIAKLIERRLSGLERAKSFIEWDKAYAFADDLRSIIDIAVNELSPLAPAMAIDCLLRFIATHEKVFERVDDSSGNIQNVYYQAISGCGELCHNLSETEADLLPEKIMIRLGESSHGYLIDVTQAIATHLPQHTLLRWDCDLRGAIEQRQAEEINEESGGWFYSMSSQWIDLRQIIAIERDDLDLFITIEAAKVSHMQDTLGVAERLLAANRAQEALDWVRKSESHTLRHPNDPFAQEKVSLEAQILEALDKKSAAQSLRLQCFEKNLSAKILREYLKRLPDFEDIEAEEHALKQALIYPSPEVALQFFLDWPRLDLAAKVITAQPHHWNGQDWHTLPKVAKLLEHEYALAATILYRALLDDILKRARSKAYGHGAKYLAQLTHLAKDADAERPDDMVMHKIYLQNLQKDHHRKTGFWSRVE